MEYILPIIVVTIWIISKLSKVNLDTKPANQAEMPTKEHQKRVTTSQREPYRGGAKPYAASPSPAAAGRVRPMIKPTFGGTKIGQDNPWEFESSLSYEQDLASEADFREGFDHVSMVEKEAQKMSESYQGVGREVLSPIIISEKAKDLAKEKVAEASNSIQKEGSLGRIFKDGFDLETAVVYSEIMKPRFEVY